MRDFYIALHVDDKWYTQTLVMEGLKAGETTKAGSLKLSWIATPGEHTLTVKVDDAKYSSDSNRVPESNDENNKLSQFIPPQIGRIVGTVTDTGTGVKLDGVLLTLSVWQKKASTNIDGDYTIDSVPIGSYELTASKPGYYTSIKVVTVENEKTTTMDFALSSSGEGISQFKLHLYKGINIISPPLKPDEPYTARKFAKLLGSKTVLRAENGTLDVPPFIEEVTLGDGFPIEGGRGYIVFALEAKDVTFRGTVWSNAPSKQTAKHTDFRSPWAFAVGGFLYEETGITPAPEGYIVTIHNPRTGMTSIGKIGSAGRGRFATAFIDSNKKSIAEVGDMLVITVTSDSGELVTGPIHYMLKAENLEVGYLVLHLSKGDLRLENRLFQNFPNPFNPETWFPFQLREPANVTIKIFDQNGRLVHTLPLGIKKAGMYTNKAKAAYWDGKNKSGEKVASGVYFYTIEAGDFRVTRKLVVAK